MLSTSLLRNFLTLLLLSAYFTPSSAQTQDSSTVDRLVHRLDSNWSERGARLFLADRIERRSIRWISTLLEYADARELGRFLAGRERILLHLVDGDDQSLLNPATLVPLLEDYEGAGLPRKLIDDDLTELLLDLSREWRNQIVNNLPRGGSDARGAEFVRLLLKATTLVGIRGVEDLNAEIDEFISDRSAGDTLAIIADRYLRRRVANDRIGVGFGFRFRTDGLIDVGESSGTVSGITGPGIGLNLFYSAWRADISFYARRVSFVNQGDPGTSLESTLEVGPDLIGGSIVLRPILGIQIGGLASDRSRSTDLRLLSPTIGLELATYQLFDDPPHLLLGVAGGYGLSSFTEEGGNSVPHWSVTFLIALSSQTHSILRSGVGRE